jgi:hypothetical protein
LKKRAGRLERDRRLRRAPNSLHDRHLQEGPMLNPEWTKEFIDGENRTIRYGIDEDSNVVQAFDGKTEVGLLEIHYIDDDGPGCNELYSADVIEGYQRRGIGSRMLELAAGYWTDLVAPDPKHNSITTAGWALLERGFENGWIRPHEPFIGRLDDDE